VNRIFLANSVKDVDEIEKQINNAYARISSVSASLQKALGSINAKRENAILKAASASLSTGRALLFANDGIFVKEKHLLLMNEKAQAAMEKLNQVVQKQAEKGDAVVLTAQGEQEKSIINVNRVVNSSRILVIFISLAAIVVGIIFGVWISRSISRPLNRLAEFSSQIAAGNLGVTLTKHSNDEIGLVENSVLTMVTNFRETIGKIKEATASLISCSTQLSTTATIMEKSSQSQNDRIEQSSAAVTEMSQTTQEVAMNTSETSSAADGMKSMAEQGRSAMHTTVQELSTFAATVDEAANKVDSLGEQSQAISSVIGLIKDVADQTNLLALNAAIEAARAGDEGRGFAVVADEVRALAQKTTDATDEIALTVSSMLKSVADSVNFMKNERSAIQRVLDNVNNTLTAIESIASDVENVTGMVQRIAVATEEQSATATDVSRAMEDIATITRDLRSSFISINGSSDHLSQVAQELNSQVGWFKL
jgi:methyl-accepting chemotaxis protein